MLGIKIIFYLVKVKDDPLNIFIVAFESSKLVKNTYNGSKKRKLHNDYDIN